MQYTENYNLNKPELTDVADITKISENMDIIDEELEKRTTKLGFLTDLITHLASDAAIAISELSTDSIFYRLLSYALTAAGVQYNFQNSNAWYICLGSLFGGLIIQGGHTNFSSGGEKTATFPISFTTDKTITTSRHWMSNWNENYYLGGGDNTKFVFTINGTTSSNSRALNWIAIGR